MKYDLNKKSIGKNCLIAANTQIFDCNGHDFCFENPENMIHTFGEKYGAHPIIIKDNVWIVLNTIILSGVTIGEGSIVAAGSIVVSDVPSFSLVGGNPAKLIKYFGNK
ncbi:DapH/DapD/GlmU-related protein [Anaerosinus massiliensis]|uniref:DapH/DapD/GlmU-related protein n=1 Tax=Massilibacillus massiliensis TaxID=1806837 RepID=UPI000DA5F907|nr:DapH/DapD/GlmU-related protein [Massilibacillus massiliensis]